MKPITEVEGRFLIFAQIGMLKFDYVSGFFAELREKFGLETAAAAIQSPFGTVNFPILSSPKLTIQFLQDHIEVIEKTPTEDAFNVYREVVEAIYRMIDEALHVSVVRLAVNGSFKIDDEAIMEKIRKSTFRDNSPLMLDKQDSWGFRTVNIENLPELDVKINQCIMVDKILPEDTPDGKTELIILYDYNTKIDQKNSFSLDEAKLFIEAGEKYKKYVIDGALK